jgi:hypothetical protein
MEITKKSKLSGKEHTMDLDITQDQIAKWLNGELIQVAMPNLTADQREFMISGATPEEWDEIFG